MINRLIIFIHNSSYSRNLSGKSEMSQIFSRLTMIFAADQTYKCCESNNSTKNYFVLKCVFEVFFLFGRWFIIFHSPICCSHVRWVHCVV